eukprot:TRINITY_DN5157_c0_g1_i1.p1 TRINITY_DN5157_c0_g1~~TRINITY_DN5157_c0_g1_i1.p1  ORF type:complete len:469 (+),score=84.09 TRINITY_DN5157_c0_g1_i1:34-1407(+)
MSVVFNEVKLNFEKYLFSSVSIKKSYHLSLVNTKFLCHFDRRSLIFKDFQGISSFLNGIYPEFINTRSHQTIIGNNWIRFNEIPPINFPSPRDSDEHTKQNEKSDDSEKDLSSLQTLFPQFRWNKVWPKFPFRDPLDDQRTFLDDIILNSFGFVHTQGSLMRVDVKGLLEHPAGPSLWSAFDCSFVDIFTQLYPELSPQWTHWRGYWRRRTSLDRLILVSGAVNTRVDLQGITNRVVLGLPGGPSLIALHQGSFKSILRDIYPELPLQPNKNCQGYWKNLKNNHILSKSSQSLEIKQKADWYRVSMDLFAKVNGKRVKKKHWLSLLRHWVPEEEWDHTKFSNNTNKRCRQRYLRLKLMELFQGEVLLEDHPFVIDGSTFIFDFYLPGLQLVIEYQGEQHYQPISNWLSLDQQLKRDQQKKNISHQLPIYLLHIPYWWDGSLLQLQQYLSKHTTTQIQ